MRLTWGTTAVLEAFVICATYEELPLPLENLEYMPHLENYCSVWGICNMCYIGALIIYGAPGELLLCPGHLYYMSCLGDL